MKGILIYDKASADYNQNAISMYLTEAKKIGLDLSLVYYEGLSYGIRGGVLFTSYEGNTLLNLDFAINRSRDSRLAKHLELMGIRVFNNSLVNEIGNHKWDTYQYLSQFEIPMLDTVFILNKNLNSFLSACKEEVVVKAVHGHGGNQVCLYNPSKPEEIDSIIKVMAKEDVVIQPFIKGVGQDLRVYVIGGKIIGAVLRTASKDFRSNYSLGGSVKFYHLKEEERKEVQKIMDCISLDYAGIDFLVTEDGSLLFNEIEDVVGARMLYACADIDAIALYVKHIDKELNHKEE